MLAAASTALLEAVRANRLVAGKLREVEPLPQMSVDELLQRYASEAPSLYLLPGTLRVDNEAAILTFTFAAVVRNVAGHEQAFKGDALDLGVDHLFLMATRAVHNHRIGPASWSLVRAEMEDDPLFDKAGIAAMSMTFESTPVEIPADWEMGELADFKTFHGDVDLKPHAGEIEYQSWLQEPPNYAQSRPDLQLDVTLEGAS